MELLNRTQLIKELLIDQSRHQQEAVARDKLIYGLLFHSSGLSVQNNKDLFYKRCILKIYKAKRL